MFIKSVKIENIRSYASECVQFKPGSTLLSGDVGSGKSTILLAIDFALFGLRKGELDGGSLLRHGHEKGFAEVEFSLNKKNIVVRRYLKRGKGIVQDSGTLSIDGTEERLMPTELRARIMELLGYPSVQKESIFRYTVYTPQEEMKKIIMQNDRVDTLRRIFGIDKYGRIRLNAKTLITDMRAAKKGLDGYAADLEKKKIDLSDKSLLLADSRNRLADETGSLSAMNKSVRIKNAEIQEVENEIAEMNAIKQDIAKKETELIARNRRLSAVENDLGSLRVAAGQKTLELDQYKSLEVPQLTRQQTVEKILSLESERTRLISSNAVLSGDATKLGEIYTKGVCVVCGQNVHDREAFKSNIDIKLLLVKECEEKIQQADNEIRELRMLQEKIVDYDLKIQRKIFAEKMLSESHERLSRLENEKNELLSELNRIKGDLGLLQEKSKLFGDAESRWRKKKLDLEKLQDDARIIERTKSRLEQQCEDLSKNMADLEREIHEKEEKKKKSVRIGEIMSWLDVNFIPLMETMEKNVLVLVQKEFNEFFQHWFGIIMEDNALGVRIDDDFSPIIEQNGYETEYTNLSGGEKTSVALAYRLALNKVINSLVDTIKTKDLLILDEPTDGFSAEQLDRIRHVIDELNLRQIIIVSHEQKIDTFVDNVIKLYKDGNFSKILSN